MRRVAWAFAASLFGCQPKEGAVEIPFSAVVGAESFACGATYTGFGASSTTWEPIDLRFYVHDVRLVNTQGDEIPVALDQGTGWQVEDVALLDFEDHTAGCANGTDQVQTSVTGTAPLYDFDGVRFKLGVPFDLNHQDAALAPSPLNLSTMFWGWQGGYKFMRLEGSTVGMPTGTMFHLGSTGCESDADGLIAACGQENVAEIALDGWDPTGDAVVFDVAALYQGVDADVNQEASAPGCMSEPTDGDCAPMFANLGLPFVEAPAGEQIAFGAP